MHDDPTCFALPHYWVAEITVEERLGGRWDLDWLLGWRDMARSADERTMICSVIPRSAVGHKLPLALPTQDAALLCACWSSFIFDYLLRQKMVGTSTAFFILKQVPVPPPEVYSLPAPWSPDTALGPWIRQRVLELTYNAYDMTAFTQDLGDCGPPFRWDKERRFLIRSELDAAFFHLYGVQRDDVGYVMDSFRALRNNDKDRFEHTKRQILRIYDALAEAERTGRPYETILDPPPGCGPRHPER
jgi:hypothetical protein